MVARVSAGSFGQISINRAKSGSTVVSGAIGAPLFAQAVSENGVFGAAKGDSWRLFDSLRLHPLPCKAMRSSAKPCFTREMGFSELSFAVPL
jgi:hypothetical protein